MSHVCIPQKWPLQESTTVDLPLIYLSLSYSIEAPALSLPLLNAVAIIRRPPITCATLETTINKGGRASVKNFNFSTFLPPTLFGCCAMTMDSPMLSPHNGHPPESTSLSVSLTFSHDASGSLTNIVKVREGSGTFDKHSERFSSTTINKTLSDSP